MSDPLAISYSLLTITCSTLCFLLVTNFIMTIKGRGTQKVAIQQYRSVLSLIRNIQKHRGLSQGLIAGDKSLDSQLEKVQRDIGFCIGELSSMLKGRLLLRWDSFYDHWLRLSKSCTRGLAEDSFQQHNQMIKNLMYLSEDISYSNNLGYGDKRQDVQHYWQHLIQMTENIGQARAMGTAALVSGEANYLQKIRIELLASRITASMRVASLQASDKEFKVIQHAVEPLLSVLTQVVNDASKVSYSGSSYYNLATLAIDKVCEVQDTELNKAWSSISVSVFGNAKSALPGRKNSLA